MSLEIKIPDVAESITEVMIAEWLKEDGEFVEQDEAVCEVETDKASQELFAEGSGILRIKVEAGETIDVGTVIAILEPAEGQVASSETETKEVVQAESSSEAPKATGEVKEMRVEPFAESITEVMIGEWLKEDGDFVEEDEGLCEVETDKATQELPAEASGILRIIAAEGSTLSIGDLICKIEVMDAPVSTSTDTTSTPSTETTTTTSGNTTYATGTPSPAASKILAEKGIDPKDVKGTGVDGRITKEDAMNAQKPTPQVTHAKTTTKKADKPKEAPKVVVAGSREQERKRLSPLRKTVARRLVSVKNQTAMLTTFNEANMQPIKDLRSKYKERFKEKYEIGLGFMSFFVKACTTALLEFPQVNAQIDGNEMILNHFCDVSIAVSAPKGLVVPVIRNAESLSFAEIEQTIKNLAIKARDNKLSIEEMEGGTFTITNGGVFGSMMSTPIINAPQSAILGMHNIVDRAVVENGQIVVRPMMYLALSYDHRIIDGRESVSFLVRVKQLLEEPERLLFGV